MNKLIYISIVFALLSCSQTKKKEQVKPVNEASFTEMRIDEMMHDFGKVKAGEIMAYSFVFTNTGDKTLIIREPEVDCGCLKVITPNNVIVPGKKGIIEVEFDSSGMVGKQLKTAQINANCKEPKHLVIFADVINEQIEFK